MRGPSPSPLKARHRLSASFGSEEANKRRLQRYRVFRDVEKVLHVPVQYRHFNCKTSSLNVLLVVILLGALLRLFRSPAVLVADYPSTAASRSSFRRWIGESATADPRYLSTLDVDWDQMSNVVEKLTDRNKYLGVGLLKFNDSEIEHWKQLLPDAEHVALHLDHVSNNITWEVLYPEWIDEDKEFEVPTCPSLPKIQVPGKPRIDLIVVKLPCNKLGRWSRDVARLHLQLEAARLAASSKSRHPVHVLLITNCFPIPNLFTCEDIVIHTGNAWLYKPNLHWLREKVQLPVGSCELAVPLKAKEHFYSERPHREAYATILHSAHVYVCGAITAAQSIRMAGST
ncbi:putative UDP-glucuronate:xylan alpha-glucuronosyltransferase 3 [Mangifera indica]|uniref:putative UDP-glucuronate:xylan alpha-glucuronosyltransferase 3 n=1 Tax=Mangifera indica TaxID=29780 RepID=UPI001CFA071E|nr:putative UDP-glucuronate:xylan alpha-glucuronosyltransferase 3 [Mangifera indica]XP_044509959.1 putative UDP-glucuronate:xylan alpha-glucuronosyltransferase 3 [Mangifera indica]